MLSHGYNDGEGEANGATLGSPVEIVTPLRVRRPTVNRAPAVSTEERFRLLKGKARPPTIQLPSIRTDGGANRPPIELRPRITDRSVMRRRVSHGYYKGVLTDPDGDLSSRISSGYLSPTPSAARMNPLASLRDMRGQPYTSKPTPSAINHQPSTLNSQTSSLNPQPSTIISQPSTLKPQPTTLYSQIYTLRHKTINPKPQALNPQTWTLNLEP
jgi:hypothetical protein